MQSSFEMGPAFFSDADGLIIFVYQNDLLFHNCAPLDRRIINHHHASKVQSITGQRIKEHK